MIFLYIIGILLCLTLILLLLPFSVHIKSDGDFFVKIKLAGIKLFEIKPEAGEKKNTPSTDTVSDKKAEQTSKADYKHFFEVLKQKYGFLGAVRSVLSLMLSFLTHIKAFLRHIKIKRIELLIAVASENAATTAIEYGGICTVAYPMLALIDGCKEIEFKKIDIKADFKSEKPEFKLSLIIRLRLIFLIITAFKFYSEYKKFAEKEHLNERK